MDTVPPAETPSGEHFPSQHWRTRSMIAKSNTKDDPTVPRSRRHSHDEKSEPRKYIIDVEETIRLIVEQEDTDNNFQISVADTGPKVFSLGTARSEGFNSFDIRGTWMLSVLLQELAMARDFGRKRIILDERRLTENPVDRLSRMIKTTFWGNLTRTIDAQGLRMVCIDPKDRSAKKMMRIYVPSGEPEMYQYYKNVALSQPELKLQVELLPKEITPSYVKSINKKPGILALAMEKIKASDGSTDFRGIPFVVPGARFNELYNWDSYFIALGLLLDDRLDLAKNIVEHFVFEIKHYGKILNGSRSYYLTRSQPPFLSDLALQVYSRLDPNTPKENKTWLKRAIQAAIKEYHTVWMAEPRFEPVCGLSRYRPEGEGIPPETEASHFTHILEPYAQKHGLSVNDFCDAYNDGVIKEPDLDVYFLHDRAVRESGHDTTYRFEKRCANLATIDLNSLLLKFEIDIATAIRDVFDDNLDLEEDFAITSPIIFGTELETKIDQTNLPTTEQQKNRRSTKETQHSSEWFARVSRRKELIDHYLWSEGKAMYFDYDTVKQSQLNYESVTSLWALWAGAASVEQADALVSKSLSKFEVKGGLVSCTQDSVGPVSLDKPNRQWDYPSAWPPHQMLGWIGLERYGYEQEAQRLAYRWGYMLTVAFVDHNGVVPEKYDAVALSHNVAAEYGNQGIDFRYYPREGFGWMNASYQLALTYLTNYQRRALGALMDPDIVFGDSQDSAVAF